MSQPVNDPIVHAPELDRPTEAEELFNELMTQLDDAYGMVSERPDMSDEVVKLLAEIPSGDLQMMVDDADDCADNVWCFAMLALKALAYRAENATEGDGDERENEGDDADGEG